jgi:DNA repair exonuclease SbcCD nuclease subunit
MTRFRFVHAADLHLDAPLEGLGRTAPHAADALRDASLDAWDALVQLAVDRDASFVLLSGDIYDGARRGVRAQIRFVAGLDALAAREVQSFIIQGNHDAADAWTAVRRWPVGVTRFGGGDVQSMPARRNGERLATVHGVSFSPGAALDNLARRFSRDEAPGLQIGMLHCNVGGRPDHDVYNPCSLDDLRAAGLDYWALGHIHDFQVLTRPSPFIVYPGALQGRSFKASDQGAKGAVVVEVSDGAISGVEFVALDKARFFVLPVDVGGAADVAALHRVLLRRLADVRKANEGAALVLRADLTGRGAVHNDLQRPGVRADLLKELRQQSEPLRPLVWWADLWDRTAPAIDREAVRARPDFSGETARLADALAADPARLQALIDERCALLARHGFGHDAELDAAQRVELLREAELLALGLLARDAPP